MAFGKKTQIVKGPKLGFGRLLAWKYSDVASAACFVIVNTYLSIFCTNYIGIEAAALGTILLLSNIIDAITDLIACISQEVQAQYFVVRADQMNAWQSTNNTNLNK